MIADEIQVIDADSHVTEPPDLWSSRVGKELLDMAPRVIRDERIGLDRWWVGEKRLGGVAASAAAGWKEHYPSYPKTLEEAHPGSWNPVARLHELDDYGVWSQVLYPNLLGFSQWAFLALPEPLRTECVKAYNDFLIDFSSEDPRRFAPIIAVPWWDVEAAVKEIRRSEAKGHKGILFPARFEKVNLPPVSDEHWYPVFELAQEHGLSLNFHVAFSSILTEAEVKRSIGQERVDVRRRFAASGSLTHFDPMQTAAELLTSGLCDRFPELKLVIVESGVGWMPYFVESLDWSWKNAGLHKTMPQQTLPSECFYRQMYGTFIYEQDSLLNNIETIQDQIMFSTDFPHPSSLSPGPAGVGPHPRDAIENLHGVPRIFAEKVLRTNAANVYNL